MNSREKFIDDLVNLFTGGENKKYTFFERLMFVFILTVILGVLMLAVR